MPGRGQQRDLCGGEMVRQLAYGGGVEILRARADSSGMVYAMNLGLALTDDSGPRVAMSHMRYPERRLETDSASRWFTAAGFTPSYVGHAGVGASFEAGDAFPFAGSLIVGCGLRTDELALKHLAADFDIAVVGLRINHPGLYHLDVAFCPLDERRALVCPAALDEASAAALLELVPEPLILTEAEGLTFCANSVVVGSSVVMPACPDRVRAKLEAWGFEVAVVDVSEFLKGGGAVRCMTNPLDIVIGRDLDLVEGGEVVFAAGCDGHGGPVAAAGEAEPAKRSSAAQVRKAAESALVRPIRAV